MKMRAIANWLLVGYWLAIGWLILTGGWLLQFDTEQFGVKTGSIEARNINSAELLKVLEDAKAEGYQLLYWNLPTGDPHAGEILDAVYKGGYFVGGKVLLCRALITTEHYPPPPPTNRPPHLPTHPGPPPSSLTAINPMTHPNHHHHHHSSPTLHTPLPNPRFQFLHLPGHI
jgi:hypothetical protein